MTTLNALLSARPTPLAVPPEPTPWERERRDARPPQPSPSDDPEGYVAALDRADADIFGATTYLRGFGRRPWLGSRPGATIGCGSIAARRGAAKTAYRRTVVGGRASHRGRADLDRSGDFDRNFRPRHSSSSQRLASLRSAFPHGDMPPIEAYEVGGAFFVSDGHHRVALALECSAEYIDAEITRLRTNLRSGRRSTSATSFIPSSSGLSCRKAAWPRPCQTSLSSSRGPADTPSLLELIKAHGYDLARRRGTLPPAADVAADWYDNVFKPGVAALRREALPELYRYKTDADLFLWVYQRRRALRVLTPDADFDRAARDARGDKVSRRFRKEFLQEKSSPLHSRSSRDASP